jgi:hypothetical protein
MRPFGFDATRRSVRVFRRVIVLAVLMLSGDVVCRRRMRRSETPTWTALCFLQNLSRRLIRALGLVVVREG